MNSVPFDQATTDQHAQAKCASIISKGWEAAAVRVWSQIEKSYPAEQQVSRDDIIEIVRQVLLEKYQLPRMVYGK